MSTWPAVPAGSAVSPCCCCPTTGDLDVVVTGYTACGCCSLPPSGGFDAVAHTGLTGANTIPIDTPGTSFWIGPIGTVDIQYYTDACATPDGTPETVDVIMEIHCDEDGLFVQAYILFPTGPLAGNLVVYGGTGQFDEAIPNDLACTGGFPFFAQPFLLDSVEVSRP